MNLICKVKYIFAIDNHIRLKITFKTIQFLKIERKSKTYIYKKSKKTLFTC